MRQSKAELVREVVRKYASVSNCDLTKSKYLPHIFDKILTHRDLMVLAALPSTPKHLAEKLGIDIKTASNDLSKLYMKGFILVEEITEDGPKYCLPTIGLVMDLILFDPQYDQDGGEIRDLWKRYWNEEHVYMCQEEGLFRVIPVEGVALSFDEVLGSSQIVPYEFVSKILKNAKRIAVQRCACRVRERRCSNPLETCISLNSLADYVVSRGIGREISLEEALEIIRKCEELGLVHQTVNSDTPDVICNCCPCCCSFLRSILRYGKTSASAKSRFIPVFDWRLCTTCEHKKCVSRCIFGALTVREGALKVDYGKCWGCGLCAWACPYEAIKMRAVRDLQHIPVNGAKFFPFEVPQTD